MQCDMFGGVFFVPCAAAAKMPTELAAGPLPTSSKLALRQNRPVRPRKHAQRKPGDAPQNVAQAPPHLA